MTVTCGDALTVLRTLPDQYFHCCVTSPPYWGLRDYGTAQWSGGRPDCEHNERTQQARKTGERAGRSFTGAQNFYRDTCRKCGAVRVDQQLGLERTPEEYVSTMVEVFRQVRRTLRDDGTLWLNLGDCYATGAGAVGECPGGGEQGSKWAGQHPGRMKQNGLNTSHGAGIGPITQPNRMPLPGLKPKDLVGMPWRIAFALQADGWYLRSDIIWHKPNPMPESVTDRPTKAHEYIYLMSKSEKYFYNADAIAEPTNRTTSGNIARVLQVDTVTNNHRGRSIPWTAGKHAKTDAQAPGRRMVDNVARARQEGASHDAPLGPTRNKRSVWTINTLAYPEAHFATFPEDLVRPCILAGCPPSGIVLEPFAGSGTTLAVARQLGRDAYGIELNPKYIPLIEKRLAQEVLPLETPETAVTSEGLQVNIFEETA